jgi:hypothetical protein
MTTMEPHFISVAPLCLSLSNESTITYKAQGSGRKAQGKKTKKMITKTPFDYAQDRRKRSYRFHGFNGFYDFNGFDGLNLTSEALGFCSSDA